MSFKARDRDGTLRLAFEASREQRPFSCQVCAGSMSLVQPQLRSRPHFRHHVESNCAWEPETLEHEAAKFAVRAAIGELGLGSADIEARVGKWIADVLWSCGGQRIAFEIQRANYTWAKFEEKLAGYEAEGIIVVYLLIGPLFRVSDKEGNFRLKDIERRLFFGPVESRTYQPNGLRVSVTDRVRVHREPIGRVVGAYLRRSANDESEIIVREPLFYPVAKGRDGWSESSLDEVGAAVHRLKGFLEALHASFIARPGWTLLNGIHFQRLEDALWGYFLQALGMTFTYSCPHPERAGVFTFHGARPTIGWVTGAKGPRIPANFNEVQFKKRPELRGDYLYVGMVTNREVPDEGVLGCYSRSATQPTVDFTHISHDYSGVISGLHDGGIPGGNLGSDIAVQAQNLWMDGEAWLCRGHAIPIGAPLFHIRNRIPGRIPRLDI